MGAVCLFIALASPSSAATLLVWQDSPTPTRPYATWETAARVIQHAVDVAAAGDTVLVTNGVYATSGPFSGFNRVRVTNAIVLASVNGPNATFIVGSRTNEGGARRCVYLGSNAVLTGFTLTNGQWVQFGGLVEDFVAGGVWCQPTAVVSNCVIRGNEAGEGGGVYGGILYNCVLEGNIAGEGGGAASSRLNFCTLVGNRSVREGGGARDSTLFHCTVTGNSAFYGGGVYGGSVDRSIVYFNSATVGPNYFVSSLRNSCAWPIALGEGNIAIDPLLASLSHLSLSSPCRERIDLSLDSVDIDGETWHRPGDLGADQLIPSQATNSLSTAIEIPYTKIAQGFPLMMTARINGQATSSRWDLGDGTVVSNQPIYLNAWHAPGTYALTLSAFNAAHPQGVSATAIVEVVSQPIHYVNTASETPVSPYTNWATASRSIQAAILADTLPGRLVLVSNGLYQVGLPGSRSVRLTNGVVVRSLNGPSATLIHRIQSPEANAAVQLAADCVLSGFTVSNGIPGVSASFSSLVTNCVLTRNNGSMGSAAQGGTLSHCLIQNNLGYHAAGMFGGRAYNCVFSGNSADYGSAAEWAVLDHCTVVSNVVEFPPDSAVGGCVLYNSIVQFNVTGQGSMANHLVSLFYNSSTTPLPTNGTANFTNAPRFMDLASGDFRLRFGSPGIDASSPAPNGTSRIDLDGRLRSLDGDGDGVAVADIGAYEFDLLSLVSTNWFLRYGLNPFEANVYANDPDQDGQTTLQEWVTGTDPSNPNSVFLISNSRVDPPAVQFGSLVDRLYTLHYATNVAGPWATVSNQTDVPGNGSLLQTLRHTNATSASFYRVSVRLP